MRYLLPILCILGLYFILLGCQPPPCSDDGCPEFEKLNEQLVQTYTLGSFESKRFIREKFGREYSEFFDKIDDDLDKQENS